MSVTQAQITIFSPSFRAAQPLACTLFDSAVRNGKVANAYLLVGRAAGDKRSLARQLTSFLNCDKVKSGETKGSCPSLADADETAAMNGWCLNCQWIWKDSHPQACLFVSGEGKSNKIPVEKIRDLTEELSKTSTFARVIVIPESDEVTFHRPAANALLKSIEEPPGNTLFLFFADSAEDVLATIVSRCQVVPLTKALKTGYWVQSQNGPDTAAKLEAAKSAFILSARKFAGKNAVPSNPAHSAVRVSTDSLELSRQLQDLFKEMCEQIDDEHQCLEQILDLVVAGELEVHRDEACSSERRSRYLSDVIAAAEKAKRQLNSYVKPANVIETFSFNLNELRHAYSGEPSLANR